MKTTVIHHSSDFDGHFCREIALRALRKKQLIAGNGGIQIDIIGWDFGDPLIPFPSEGDVILMDLPPDVFEIAPSMEDESGQRFVWIDHHASAIQKWGNHYNGIQLDGVAACRLAYQWFMPTDELVRASTNMSSTDVVRATFPDKEDYLERKVIEPKAVTLVGEYDVWDHKRSRELDIVFQYGLDAADPLNWDLLLDVHSVQTNDYVADILTMGRAAKACFDKRNADAAINRGFDVTMDGLNFRALNTTARGSGVLEASIKPHHDGGMVFFFNGKEFVCSLYGVPHKPDLDLSKLAVARGGGGHRTACGFRCETMPFNEAPAS